MEFLFLECLESLAVAAFIFVDHLLELVFKRIFLPNFSVGLFDTLLLIFMIFVIFVIPMGTPGKSVSLCRSWSPEGTLSFIWYAKC